MITYDFNQARIVEILIFAPIQIVVELKCKKKYQVLSRYKQNFVIILEITNTKYI